MYGIPALSTYIHMQYLYVFELWLRFPLGQNERTDYKPRVYYLYLFENLSLYEISSRQVSKNELLTETIHSKKGKGTGRLLNYTQRQSTIS